MFGTRKKLKIQIDNNRKLNELKKELQESNIALQKTILELQDNIKILEKKLKEKKARKTTVKTGDKKATASKEKKSKTKE